MFSSTHDHILRFFCMNMYISYGREKNGDDIAACIDDRKRGSKSMCDDMLEWFQSLLVFGLHD